MSPDNPTVLVVDDDAKAVELIAVRILGLASTVLRAYGGKEAIEVARRELHLVEQLGDFLFAERLDVVVDFGKIKTIVDEKAIHLATLRAGGFFVDCYGICHFLFGG